MQRVAKVTELDEDSIISAESLLAPDNFSELLDSAFFSDELDRLDPFDSALLSLEIASSHSSEAPAQREEEDKVSESAEETELEDERPCFSALLNAAGSLFSAEADDESSHAAKNANNTREIATHFVLAMTCWMDPITAPFDKLRDQRLQDDRSRIFFIKASK